MLYVRLTIKVKVGVPESFKVGWYPHKMTGSSHLNEKKRGRELKREKNKEDEFRWKNNMKILY